MPDLIQLLPDSVANQIAAGEVIQRPASVVKELVENAIDSGATQVTVNIKDAGRTLIQVSDNGCGMSVTDARMAFERHATSKIRSANDLFAIRTMGFRGRHWPPSPPLLTSSYIPGCTMKRSAHLFISEGPDYLSRNLLPVPVAPTSWLKTCFLISLPAENF